MALEDREKDEMIDLTANSRESECVNIDEGAFDLRLSNKKKQVK